MGPSGNLPYFVLFFAGEWVSLLVHLDHKICLHLTPIVQKRHGFESGIPDLKYTKN